MITETTQCLMADTDELKAEVYRLRYACYRRKRSIPEREDGQFSESFDDQPNSFSFLVRNREREALATVRITVVRPDLGWTDSPVNHVQSWMIFRVQPATDCSVNLHGTASRSI